MDRRVQQLVADVTTLEGADAAVRSALGAFGSIGVLANVVGGSRSGKTVVDLPLDDWNTLLSLNLTSMFLMCKAVIPHMAAVGRGSIVNVSSGAGLRGMKANPGYCAAKGGVVAFDPRTRHRPQRAGNPRQRGRARTDTNAADATKPHS